MQNKIAQAAEQVLVGSGFGGRVDLVEHRGSDYWMLWYKVPPDITRSYGLVVLVVAKISESGQDRITGEVSLQGGGRCLFDPGTEEYTEEQAVAVATRLVEWAKLKFSGVKPQEDKMTLVDIAADVFAASGLGGTVYCNDSDSVADATYCLPAEDGKDAVMLGVVMNRNRADRVFTASAWNSGTGVVLYRLPPCPATEESVRESAEKLVSWAKQDSGGAV